MSTAEFIATYRDSDLTQAALRVRQYPLVDAAFALQQIEGWQRAKGKLPSMANIEGWLWPKRISVEQCSSQLTAEYKQQLVAKCIGETRKLTSSEQIATSPLHSSSLPIKGADLTGGMGVDTFFLSEEFDEWHYVEQQEELCQLASHNFHVANHNNIRVHHCAAESFLASLTPEQLTLLYLDPARRAANGGKVFRLQDCTPDITTLYPQLAASCQLLLLKLSPMLDITAALASLPHAREIHILAVHNEVKELLILCSPHAEPIAPTLIAVNLSNQIEQLAFTMADESVAIAPFATHDMVQPGYFLYEPNAAILKAGAYKLLAQRYGLKKAGVSTHLYLSDQFVSGFPGRVFRVIQPLDKAAQKVIKGQPFNIICRNYPLRTDELKHKLHLRDGGNQYLIGLRLDDASSGKSSATPLLLHCERL